MLKSVARTGISSNINKYDDLARLLLLSLLAPSLSTLDHILVSKSQALHR